MLNQDKKKDHELEEQASKKVTRWILSGLGAILVLVVLIGGCYVGYAIQPANRHDEDVVSVHIREQLIVKLLKFYKRKRLLEMRPFSTSG